jgi:hypothetical protein
MTPDDYGLQETKNAWLVFKEARDRFEKATWELRIRYVKFAYKHGSNKNADAFKIRESMHLQALNPEDFEEDMLFMDRDSIFGVEYHQVPADYFADPDKWEAEFLLQQEEEKRKRLRHTLRLETRRLKASSRNLAEIASPAESLIGKSIAEDLSVLKTLRDFLVREVTEAGGKEEIETVVTMVALTSKASKDDIQTALVYAEDEKDLFVRGIEVYTPEEYSYLFEQIYEEEESGE